MSWLFQTKPRRTRAQTAASRRNLYVARAEQARRRRRAAAPTVNPKFVVVVVCVVVLLALVVVTRGLAVISAALVLTAYLVWKRRRFQEEDARVAALIKARLERSQTIDGMLGLTPKGFEESVAEIMIYLGYTEVDVLGGAGDEGADIRAIDPGGLSVVVQCKQYGLEHKVGSPEAQHMLAAKVNRQAGRGILVTTSTFTAPAAAYALKNGLELVDGHQLANWAHHALHIQTAATEESDPAPSVAGEAEFAEDVLVWVKRAGRLARHPAVLVAVAIGVLVLGLGIHAASPAITNASTAQPALGSATTNQGSAPGSTPAATASPTTGPTVTESSPTTTVDLSETQAIARSDSAQVQSEIEELSSDGSSVTAATESLNPDLSSLAQGVAQAKADDERAHTDAASPETASEVCGDASTVNGDVSTVEGDLSTIRADQSTFQAATGPATSAAATLKQDMVTLAKDETVLPPSAQSGFVTQADVDAALANLSQAISAGQTAVNAALNTAQTGLSQAQTYAADAQALCAS